MSNNFLAVREKKLNIKHVLIVIIALIIVIILITFSKHYYQICSMKKQTIKTANILSEKQAEIDKKKEEEYQKILQAKKEEIEKENKRYAKLNSDDLEKVSNIYKHNDKKRVFLTFDDGPTKAVTPYILSFLKQENIKANFFVLGKKVEANPSLVKEEYQEGHFIGNHSYSHKYSLIYESVDSTINEYNKTNDLIKKAIGNDRFNSLIFRFPGGSVGGTYNDIKQEALKKFNENGIGNVDWNALTSDAAGAKTKEALMNSFYETVKNKTSVVLLMHDSADKILTYEVLPDIVKYFRDNGYEFQTIYDLLGRE